MKEKEDKYVTFRQNPNIDFLFGYFDGMQIPTKQDAYKPIDVVEIDENGAEPILKEFYQKKPEKNSIKNFKQFIKELTKERFTEDDRIKMPNKVQVSLSFSLKVKRFFEVNVDNLFKTVLDSLNGIAYDDDKQVTSLIVDKHIHKMKVNGILIAITKLTDKRKGLQYKWD
jgi:Holliday junction resolvase RusA-like endonuclease